MCGIIVIMRSGGDTLQMRKKALGLSAKLRHRGPDWSGICVQEYKNREGIRVLNVLAHERLAIVDPINGAQPLLNKTRDVALAVNGEIWNHKKLRQELEDYEFSTDSDCEPIIPLYMRHGDSFINMLDGIFAFVISDQKNDRYFAARDGIGVMSFYVGWRKDDSSVWFSSEIKGLLGEVDTLQEFPPGHFWSSHNNRLERWYQPSWIDRHIPTAPLDLERLRQTLEKSVVKRLMTDVPYGVLLSGGLDSSLVASIVCRHAKKRVEENEKSPAWWPQVHTFSIGLKGSPDLEAARQVSKFLQTVHHEFHFTLEEGLDALPQVIYHIETYDLTTIRASTPMFLLARRIKAMGVKMVLSGEGADEVFGGYLYFHKAPSPEAFHVELCDKICLLSKYDCLRANKSCAAWGVESREPFLDKDFLDVAMGIDPKQKMIRGDRIEKWILRKAFDTRDNPYLPDSVLWRQKEQFSDGVGYNWINGLKEFAQNEVSDEEFSERQERYPYNTPATKEAFLYRRMFEHHFPGDEPMKTVPGGPSIACSTAAAVEWDATWKSISDPSGRSIAGVHVNTPQVPS